nr:hypothetical protein [uncultured Acetatifactor sp.]
MGKYSIALWFIRGGTAKYKNEKVLMGVCTVGIFILSMLFFTKIHPIVIADTDDWYFAYKYRSALPLWEGWNPIRVFPEVFMPIVSMFGRFFINIFIKEYFLSLTYSYALAVSFVIAIFIYSLFGYLRGQNIDIKTSVILILFFVICHFWIFRTSIKSNEYMLGSIDASTYFFYVIPNLLNCIAVLLMQKLVDSKTLDTGLCTKKSLYILLIYFCIFSNIWSSMILASYIGTTLLKDILTAIAQKVKAKDFIKKQCLQIGIIIMWLASQIFELNGGRAKAIKSESYIETLQTTLKVAKKVIIRLNNKFLMSMLIIVIIGITLTVLKKQWKLLRNIQSAGICCIIMIIYLVLSCAMAGSKYLERTDVIYGCFFYGMIIILLCLYQIMTTVFPISSIMPLLLVIVALECNTDERTFRESNVQQLSPQICMDIDNDIMKQFLDAQDRGEAEIILYVPFFEESSDNWPLAVYATETISEHFYKMGVTYYKIRIKQIVPLVEKSKELNVDKF